MLWRRLNRLIVIAAVVGLAAAGFAYFQITSWAERPVFLTQPQEIDLSRGTGLKSLADTLKKQQVISSALAFRFIVRAKRAFPKFQAGHYRFEGKVSPNDIIATISTGKVYNPVVLEFVIPEGFTSQQIAERLQAKGIGKASQLKAMMRNSQLINSLGVKNSTLEGFLYPATYRFFRKMPTPKETLTKMVKEFFTRLPEGYEEKVKKKGITFNQAVVFASLIERETLHEDEKPLVSEVIWRRLNDGVPLGIDAALIYGIKNYDGNIRWKHLKDASNPYNTRIHKGLPPTAICSPSVSSLMAVLNPASEKNYYYVLLPGTDGRHHFSKTLEEPSRLRFFLFRVKDFCFNYLKTT